MDLVGKTGCNMPGEGLFVPGRERTASQRSQGSSSPPTIIAAPALRLSRGVNAEAEGHFALRRRTTNLSGRLASDCHVPHNCSPMPRVAHTPRRLRRHVCALSHLPAPSTPHSSALAASAENTVTMETNPTSPLESTKLEKGNERTGNVYENKEQVNNSGSITGLSRFANRPYVGVAKNERAIREYL